MENLLIIYDKLNIKYDYGDLLEAVYDIITDNDEFENSDIEHFDTGDIDELDKYVFYAIKLIEEKSLISIEDYIINAVDNDDDENINRIIFYYLN